VSQHLLAVGLELLAGVLVALGLTCLREQDQWGRVGGLDGEREVEQDERVGVPAQADGERVDGDPQRDRDRLAEDVLRRPKKRAAASARRPKGSSPKAP
jgi:hypothetical protein